MPKTLKVLKFGILSLAGVCLSTVALAKVEGLWFGISNAQERGIGASPARIDIAENVEWPHEVSLYVTNFSAEPEQFEVLLEADSGVTASVDPGRFLLGSGERTRVLVGFEKPPRQTEGVVKIVSVKTSESGFTTGMGVKIPFRIEKADSMEFLAGAGKLTGSFRWERLLGAGMIAMALILLWYMADMVRLWIFNSSRQ